MVDVEEISKDTILFASARKTRKKQFPRHIGPTESTTVTEFPFKSSLNGVAMYIIVFV